MSTNSKKRKRNTMALTSAPSVTTTTTTTTKNVSARRLVSQVKGHEVQSLLKALSTIQSKLKVKLGTLPLFDLSPPRVEINGAKTPKHIAQHTSLIAHLQRFHLTSVSPTLFIEFGSGVGRFSSQLQEETNAAHYHLMIDRETFKTTRLRDTTMRKRAKFDSVKRLTTDIKDLNLDSSLNTLFDINRSSGGDSNSSHCSFDDVHNTSKRSGSGNNIKHVMKPLHNIQTIPIVALSKHLCGSGFDMALKTIFDYQSCNLNRMSPQICMTPCCHCLCTWEDFTFKRFFRLFNLTELDFEVMCAVSQWSSLRFKEDAISILSPDKVDLSATNGGDNARVLNQGVLATLNNIEKGVDQRVEEEENIAEFLVLERQIQLLEMSSKDFEKNLSRHEKRILGRACKECIDIARVCGILEHGYTECHMFRYTKNSTEDLLIVSR